MSNEVELISDDTLVPIRSIVNCQTGYILPSSGRSRRLMPDVTMRVTAGELRELFFSPGGSILLQNYINVGNKSLAAEFGVPYDAIEYDWTEAKRLGFRSYDLPRKDMWHQIRGYVVKNEYAESLICALSGVDFMGRWMPEAQSNSAMYNKEYYWSDTHTFFNNPYYCGLEWVNIDSGHLNCVFPEKVLIPVKQYYSERKGELNSLNSEIASIYWHKPCEEMYTKLQLKYLKGSNSAFVDGAGELVCFESSELIGNDTGFYIRYDKLLEFLKSSSYTLVWTSLCEKRILTPSFGRWDLPPKAIHMSSVYYLKDGKIAKASETLFEDRLYY